VIHIDEAQTSVVRVYARGRSFDAGDEPCAVATLTSVDAGTVEVTAAMGRVTRTHMRELARTLAVIGVHTLVIKRRTGHRVPYGRLTKTHGPFSYYAVQATDI
jgi:hypothetical protein